MKKPIQIIEVEIPVAELADLSLRAAAAGVSRPRYFGILLLSGAYGISHPDVMAYAKRDKAAVSGPVIDEAGHE